MATKDELDTIDAAKEMYAAIPKAKRGEFIGHLNMIFLAIDRAKSVAEQDALDWVASVLRGSMDTSACDGNCPACGGDLTHAETDHACPLGAFSIAVQK